MLLAAPLLLALLRCLEGGRAASAPSSPAPQDAPAAPQHVRFLAHTFRHRLLWAPGRGTAASSGLLYDVQYRRYGNHSWTPAARCTAIARLSCDLTPETAEPQRRYFARVRAVAPDGTSGWTPTGPFSPKEATLQLWNISLSLSGNTLRVTLEPPVHRGEKSTVAYEDLHPGGWSQYHVHVRRASDNAEQVHVESSRTFELPALLWGERYCVSVEPHLPSRPNPTERTEEQCFSTPPPQDSARARVILSCTLLSLGALGTLAVACARAHVRKPMETPLVLKSFRKQTSPVWLWSEPWPLGMRGGDLCSEVESIRPLSLGQKTHAQPRPARASLSSRAAWSVPEQEMCWKAKATPSSPAEDPQRRDLTDSSGCSTDSGICLQDPRGGSHSVLLPTGPWGCGGQLPGGNEEGGIQKRCDLELEEVGLPLTPPTRKAEPVGLGPGEALAQAVPPHTQVSGYQRQAGVPGEALASPSCPPSPEGVALSLPALASGYLKQASVTLLSALGDPADSPETGPEGPIGSTQQGGRHLLSSVAPGGWESLPCLPESPKALLALSFLGQEPVWPPPHLSLLCAKAPLSLGLPWRHV